jgi:hypothetical protein
MTFMTFTPFVAVVMGTVGEVACLDALFTGHPTRTNATLTIAALVTIAAAMLIHPLILSFRDYSLQHLRSKGAGPDEASSKDASQPQQGPD